MIALLLLLQAGADWPTYHGGYSLDGFSPAAVPDAPVRLWRHKAPARVESAPVIAGGRVYFVAKNELQALDLADGKLLWRRAIGEKERFSAPPMAADGLVIAGTDEGKLLATRAADGAPAWSYDVGEGVQGSANRVALPGGKDGIVVIAQASGTLHAVDLATGKGAWKSSPHDRADGSPGVGAGRIAMGSCASALHVFSAEKGERIVDIPLGGECQVAGGVAMSGSIAYAGTRPGKVFAVDLASQKILWTNEDTRKEAFATPALAEKLLLFAADDGKLYALDRATGKQVWKQDTGGAPSSPVVAGTRVIVCAGGSIRLFALEDGKPLATLAVADDITSPALSGGRIVVGADDGTVSAWGAK